MSTIYVVMSNDYPDGKAFRDEAKAQEYVDSKNADDKAKHKSRRTYYRHYGVELVE